MAGMDAKSQVIVHDFFEEFSAAARLLVQLSLHIIVESQSGSHILMLSDCLPSGVLIDWRKFPYGGRSSAW